MPSFQIAIEPNRRAAARFVGQVRRSILKALKEEHEKTGITQADIARALGVHRSVINRELKGFKDITLGRVAELAWALGRKPQFNLNERNASFGQNTAPAPITITSIVQTATSSPVSIESNSNRMSARAA